MRALVFGGMRRLGYHVMSELRKAGHDVAVIDFVHPDPEVELVSMPAGVSSQVLPSPLTGAPIPSLEFESRDFDAVFFCGLDPYPDAGDLLVLNGDITAERQVLGALLASGPSTLVLTSSATVYDLSACGSVLAEDAPIAPEPRGTAAHLLDMEQQSARAVDEGWRVATLRCGVIAGTGAFNEAHGRVSKIGQLLPGLRPESIDYPAVKLVLEDPPYEPACTVGDLVHVSDVASAEIETAKWLSRQPQGSHTFNVGAGVTPTPAEIAELLEGSDSLDIEIRAERIDLPKVVLDSSAIASAVGWRATMDAAGVAANELAYFKAVLLGGRKLGPEVRVGHEYVGSSLSARHLTIRGLLVVRDKSGDLLNKDLRFQLGAMTYEAKVWTKRGIRVPFKYVHLSPYRLRIPREHLAELGLQNPLRVLYIAPDGRWLRRHLKYSSVFRTRPDHRRSRVYRLPENDSALYVRQTDGRTLNVTVRAPNVTDRLSVQLKIRLAWLASRLLPRKSVLLYEKQSARYEESAAVVYEKMMDRGLDAHYILAPEALSDVPERYRGRIVRRFSFRHFYHFFCATTFIGTETVFSAAELRSADRMLMRRISRHRYQFVFLQHGVMYMVALSSRQRKFFRAGEVFPFGTKIVCSSKREARHFIDLGGFAPEDMYVCGLPKFDHATRDAGADLILIMPTWRPWEHNSIRTDPTSVPYYLMVREMYEAVPDELKPKVRIMPHPLVKDMLVRTDLRDRMWTEDSYDAALRRCEVLITDYSSIAYDALYRGAKVIFWWKEKDDCMQQYGGHLMIDEETAPGRVCYETDELRLAVSDSYLTPQDDEYVRRYREIVEFHDGRNTERLLAMMERDGFI